MSAEISRVLDRLADDDANALSEATRACRDIDERLDDGESALFHAVLSGRAEFVDALLNSGADPNFRAAEPAEDMLARTPLELAQQARFLMDWDRYHPIAVLLQAHGARDADGCTDTPRQIEQIEARARAWQSGRVGWSARFAGWIIALFGRLQGLVVRQGADA
jgi:hypothetical protein